MDEGPLLMNKKHDYTNIIPTSDNNRGFHIEVLLWVSRCCNQYAVQSGYVSCVCTGSIPPRLVLFEVKNLLTNVRGKEILGHRPTYLLYICGWNEQHKYIKNIYEVYTRRRVVVYSAICMYVHMICSIVTSEAYIWTAQQAAILFPLRMVW